MQFNNPQDKSERAWLNGAVVCESDDCQDQAAFECDGKAACDWHASTPERQAMMPRKPAADVVEGDLVVIDNLEDRVVASHPDGPAWWLVLDVDELLDRDPMVVARDRPVATWDPRHLTRGTPS